MIYLDNAATTRPCPAALDAMRTALEDAWGNPSALYRPGQQARVASIFTGTSISPDVLPRQRSNHYAFRAGRNLPDKEFRYLRTVIVTAAVYWGLNSKLRLR